MAQNNDPLFQTPKQFLKTSATQPPLDAGVASQEVSEDPVLQTRPSYADVASIQSVGPSAMRTAPNVGDFSDEKLLEMMRAPLTGEEVAAKIADLNANGVDISADTISKDEFVAYESWRKQQHFNFWGAVGDGFTQASKEIGGGVVSAATDWKKVGLAAGLGFLINPVAGLSVAFGATAIEGFARGTRDLGGLAVMAANHPSSPLYRMFVNPTDDQDVAYQDFLDLASWNAQTEKILSGKTNAFMADKQTYEKLFGKEFGGQLEEFTGVNKELATAASYVLDPTTFMTFGGGAAGKAVANKASAAAIKSGQAGNAVGHAMAATASRNAAKSTFLNSMGGTMVSVSNTLTKPIDAMFDAITGGMERITGVRHNVSPVTGDVKAQRVHVGHGGEKGPRSLTHAVMGIGGVYSAFSIPYALPITSVYAGLKGVKYLGEGLIDIGTKGAKNADSIVGSAIRASSPIGIYMTDMAKTSIHGGIYGGVIGYAAGGEEGAAGGIGTGVALGAIGHNVGYAYGTISGSFAKDALYKEFDEHMAGLKDKGELLKNERVTEFIAKITAQHGKEEGLRAISHIMALEKSKNVTVAYMNYDDMVAAVLNDPNMTEEYEVPVPQMQVNAATLKPVDPNAPTVAQPANPTPQKRKRLTPMGQTLADAIKAKSEGGQGWNGMFTTQHPITGETMTKPYAIFKNGETGKYHVIINTDNVQAVRDAAGNVVMRYGPEGARPSTLVPEGKPEYTFEPKGEEKIDFDENGNIIGEGKESTGWKPVEFTKEEYLANKEIRQTRLDVKLIVQLGFGVDTRSMIGNTGLYENLTKAGWTKEEIDASLERVHKYNERYKKALKEQSERIKTLSEPHRKRIQEINKELEEAVLLGDTRAQERLQKEAVQENEKIQEINKREAVLEKVVELHMEGTNDIAYLMSLPVSERVKEFNAIMNGETGVLNSGKFEALKKNNPEEARKLEQEYKKGIIDSLKGMGMMSDDGKLVADTTPKKERTVLRETKKAKIKELDAQQVQKYEQILQSIDMEFGGMLEQEAAKYAKEKGLPESTTPLLDLTWKEQQEVSERVEKANPEFVKKRDEARKTYEAERQKIQDKIDKVKALPETVGDKKLDAEILNVENQIQDINKREDKAFDTFLRKFYNRGKPTDQRGFFSERRPYEGTMNSRDAAKAQEMFYKTNEGKALLEARNKAYERLRRLEERALKKTQTAVATQKLKKIELAGPVKPKWEAPVTKVATTAPLGELWHVMNQVYREVNHQQTITSEVRSWLLDRAFTNRADTVKFMHEVYRRIGGANRDINAEGGRWMKAINEFEQTGKIENPEVAESFNRFCEELGEAIFLGWEDGKPFDYILRGGDLGFARNLIDGISDAFYNRALREATNLGADIRTKDAFVDWFKRSRNSGVRIDPILANTFKDLTRFYNDKNMKNAGLGRTDLVKFTPAMIKEHATIYGYENRLQYGANGEVTGLKPMLQYNQESHQAGKAMIQELAELATTDEAALNGLDFYIYNDGDDVDLAMNGTDGTLDTVGRNGKGFLFQSPDYNSMGVGLDAVVNAQKSKAPQDGIYAPRDAKVWGKRGRARTTPTGRMGADMKEALAKGQHVVFRGIPTEKAFKIIEKYVPKSVADNVRLLAPLIADGGVSMSNVINGKYLGFTQATRDGNILSREWGDSFSPRDVTFVPYDMQFKVTLKDLKNPTQDYKRPHFRFNVRSVDIDALNRRGTILWTNSPELQGLYKGIHEFKADIFKTIDEYSGSGEIPATDFFGADDDARLRRKHVVAAIGASPNQAAELEFHGAEAEWHSYQKRDRGAEQNNPWFWMHMDGLHGLHSVEGEVMRMRMNEKGYYRAMVPTPTHEGARDSFGNPMMEQMYQSPDLTPSQNYATLAEEKTSLEREIQGLNEKIARQDKFGRRGNNPSYSWLNDRRREAQNRLDAINQSSGRPMFQSPDELADLNYDALYGKGNGPNGKRNMLSSKSNLTPTLAGERYDMTDEPWNAGFIGKFATQGGGRWQYVGSDGNTKKGDVIGHKTEFKIRKMSEGKGKYRLDVTLNFIDNFGDEYGSIGGTLSKDGKSISEVSVQAIREYQGQGYGNVMYSELFERMRALGVENFDGEVINPEGRPIGVRDNLVGKGNTYIMNEDWDKRLAVATPDEIVRRLQNDIDLGDVGGVRVRSKLNKSAFYQSPDAPIKLDIDSMRRFHAETSDKPYDANRVAEGMDDPVALLKRLSKMEIFKKRSVRGDYAYAETWGAKNDADAGFLASNFKYAAEKGDVFQSDALQRFVQQTTGSKDVPIIRHTLEEFVSSTNAGIDAYNQSFKTGSPVAFVATNGTMSNKLGGGDFRRNIKSLKPHNHFNGQQATSYAYSYGGPEFANSANAFPEGNQVRAAIGMKNPLVYNFDGEYLRDDIVSTLIDKAKREKRDGIIMLNAIDPRVSSNVKDNHYIVPKGNEHQIAVIDNSFGKKPNPRGLNGAEGSKMFQNPDDGVTLPKGIFGPNNPETVKIGRSIMMKKGIAHAGGSFIVRLNPEKSFKIGMAYDSMKHDPFNPLVRQAYEAMARETLEQYQAIVDAGYTAEMHYEQEEPYANSRDAIKDIRENKRLRVLATDLNLGATTISAADIKENPLLSMSAYKDSNGRQMRINDVFRFVHDFFGHSERGNGFGPIGEENAWDVHSRMYSPLARRAMTSETRGQNSWVNFVNESNIEINRKRELVRRLESEGRIVEAAEIRKTIGQTRFADQKIGLMPEWTSKLDEQLTPIEKDMYGVHQTLKGGFGLYQQADGTDVNIHSPTAEQFSAMGNVAKQANKFGTSVDIKAPQDYSGYELIMAGDGLAHASISPDGELGSIVRGVNGTAKDVDAVVRAAIATGKVKWINAFDTVLPSLYSAYGFEAVARIAFVDEYRPDGWDYAKYAKFNNGRPDVVFMALVGSNPIPYEKNGKHIPMVASYDDAVRLTKERNKSASNGGTLFQNSDLDILRTEERTRYETNELRLKYAEYVRFVDEQIKAGTEGFNNASRILKLRQWFNINSPKGDDGKPLYSPISIGERVKVGNTMVDIKDFTESHRDAVREEIMDKARERQNAEGLLFTPEQLDEKKRKEKSRRRQAELLAKGAEWMRKLDPEDREEMLADQTKVKKPRTKKEGTIGDVLSRASKEEMSEKDLIEEETENLIDEGYDPVEAKKLAEQAAKERAQNVEFVWKNPEKDAVLPVEELRFMVDTMTVEDVAKQLKKEDLASREKGPIKDVFGGTIEEDVVFTDEEYMEMAENLIQDRKEQLGMIEKGMKRPEPKDKWRVGGDSPEINIAPTIRLADLYKKFRNTEYFNEKGKPLQWRKKDGTIVKSDKKVANAEPVEPPEIIEAKAEVERAIKEIRAIDYNTRGINALVGLMMLWGYRLNPNLLDSTFDPSNVNFDKLMENIGNLGQEEALRVVLSASGQLVTSFESGAQFQTIIRDIPDLVETTSEVLSLIMRTTEFAPDTFGRAKNEAGVKREAKELMAFKFVEKYYAMMKSGKGNTFGATLDDIFYISEADYADDKIRDDVKNFTDTNKRPPNPFEKEALKEERRQEFRDNKGRVLINQFFAPEPPIDPKTGKKKEGWQDKTTSIEKNIKNRLRETSKAAKAAGDLKNIMDEARIKTEADSIVFNLQRDFIEFMFEEANQIFEEQIAKGEEADKKKRRRNAQQFAEARNRAMQDIQADVRSGKIGWEKGQEQFREILKKLEAAHEKAEEPMSVIEPTSEGESTTATETPKKGSGESIPQYRAPASEKKETAPMVISEMEANVKKVEMEHRRAKHEAQEKQRKVWAELNGEEYVPIPFDENAPAPAPVQQPTTKPVEPATTVPPKVEPAKESKPKKPAPPKVEPVADVEDVSIETIDAGQPTKKKKVVSVNTTAQLDTARKEQVNAETVKPPQEVAQAQVTLEQVGPIGARSVQHQQAVKDVLAIKDNLTLEDNPDGTKRSIATKDKRYVVHKGIGNNKSLYVWMSAHEDVYRGTPLDKRRIAIVNSYEEAQLAIREFDTLMRVLAEREGLNTSQILQASAPVVTPAQAVQVAQQVVKQVKQNPQPPPATPTKKAQLHPEFSNAVMGVRMSIKMTTADAKKMVETAIDRLGPNSTLQDIIKQVLLDRQALAAEVAKANELFAAAANAGAGANPDAVAQVTITPSTIGLKNTTGAPRLPAGRLSNPNAEIGFPNNFNPSAGEIAMYKMLTTFRQHANKYAVGSGQTEGVIYVNAANYAIVQSGPSKWRLFNPAKALMSVWDNEQQACDAIFKHYFKR
jgi:hypothetical protein